MQSTSRSTPTPTRRLKCSNPLTPFTRCDWSCRHSRAPLPNPNGIPSFSPGLAVQAGRSRNDYPGSSCITHFNPNGVASSLPEFLQPLQGCVHFAPLPSVAAARQHWAEGCNHVAVEVFAIRVSSVFNLWQNLFMLTSLIHRIGIAAPAEKIYRHRCLAINPEIPFH